LHEKGNAEVQVAEHPVDAYLRYRLFTNGTLRIKRDSDQEPRGDRWSRSPIRK